MSTQAEIALISAVLFGGTDTFDKVSHIKPDDFQNQIHRQIWSGIIQCSDIEIDPFSVSECLEAQGVENRGHQVQVMDLFKTATTSANARHYADIVLEDSRHKQIDSIISRLTENRGISSPERAEQAASALDAIFQSSETTVHIGDFISGYLQRLDNRTRGECQSIKTGFADIDNLVRIAKGNLWIVAARPKMGKTTLAMNIANEVCKSGGTVIVYSMEMGKDELLDRQISNRCSISLTDVRKGTLNPDEWAKIASESGVMKKEKLFIDDTAAQTIFDLKSRSRLIKRKHGLDLIVVDYLQLMKGSGQNRNLEIQGISQGLKAMAKELDCPVIALSQLNRAVEARQDKRPYMSDLRDSGSIEQDADGIIFIYRDEIYNTDTEYKGMAEIIVAAQRNGETGKVFLTEQLQFNRFRSFYGDLPKPRSSSKAGFNYDD